MRVIINAQTGETIIDDTIEETNESLKQVRDIKLSELMSNYKSAIVSGFSSSATGTDVRYGYKEQDQLNYSKIANLFALNPLKEETILGSDSHGVVTLSKQQFLQFMEDAERYEMDMYVKRKTLESRVNSATTVEELNEITLSF